VQFALVVPALREAANLRPLLERVRAALDPTGVAYEVLVVDDDSRDKTEDLVRSIAHQDPRVRLLVRTGVRGLSGAILHGWQHSEAGILGVMDADLQHPPELLPKLLDAVLGGCDLAIASRYAKGGSPGGWNPLRRLISAAAVGLALPLQRRGLRVKDPMSGYFVVRRSCVDKVVFQTTGFKLLLETLVRGTARSVREIPLAFGKRRAGASKASLKVAWEYLLLLAKLYAAKGRRVRVAPETAGD
jgi:dolichol-phosphate mannosyltransferase